MAYTRNLVYRNTSNSRLSNRAKQWLALLGAIVIGMIISATVNAIPSSKAQTVATKATLESTVSIVE